MTGWTRAKAGAWARNASWFDVAFAPFDAHLLGAADCHPGFRVLDVGCGTGATTLAVAQLVGPSGHVLAVDVSEPMCTVTAARIPPGLARVQVIHGDAATIHYGPERLDRVVSRLGVMFFAEPPKAFAHLASAMGADGRIAFLAPVARIESPWIARTVDVLAPHLPEETELGPDPAAFSLADPAVTTELLIGAGFTDLTLTRLTETITLGGGLGIEPAVEQLSGMDLPARILRQLPDTVRRRAVDDLRTMLREHLDNGAVRMPAAVWLVAGTRTA